MSAHTPGPWRVAGYAGEHDEAGAAITSSFDGYRVATTTCVEGDEWTRYYANACLIAAAPDLLTGCKESLNALRDYVEQLEEQGGMMGYGRSVIRRLEAAIAKAEGPS